MMKMISDYAYTGPIGITLNMLLEHQSQIRTYYYQYGYSGSQSLCDKQVYYGWKYSIKLQLQNLGLGMDLVRNGLHVARILLGGLKKTRIFPKTKSGKFI